MDTAPLPLDSAGDAGSIKSVARLPQGNPIRHSHRKRHSFNRDSRHRPQRPLTGCVWFPVRNRLAYQPLTGSPGRARCSRDRASLSRTHCAAVQCAYRNPTHPARVGVVTKLRGLHARFACRQTRRSAGGEARSQRHMVRGPCGSHPNHESRRQITSHVTEADRHRSSQPASGQPRRSSQTVHPREVPRVPVGACGPPRLFRRPENSADPADTPLTSTGSVELFSSFGP